MAHRTEEKALQNCAEQQRPPAYRFIIVWRKDWERWSAALASAVDVTRYDLIVPPIARTKNQLCITQKKVEA